MLRGKKKKAATLEKNNGGMQETPRRATAKAKGKSQLKASHELGAKAQLALEKAQVQKLRDSTEVFDAHCFYLDWRQKTDGIDALMTAMAANGIGMAALTGCPLKKAWLEGGEYGGDGPPEHHLYDDGDLYFYSLTDALVYRDLQRAEKRRGNEPIARLLHNACGFNLSDRGVGEEAETVIDEFDVHGLGVVYLQSDDVNNMTVKNGTWTHTEPAVSALLQVAGKQLPAPMPFFFISDACASSAKPYAESYEYIPEVEFVLSQARGVRCVWVGAGVFHRGQWPGYAEVVSALLTDNPNLYVSFTPELIAGELALPADWALDMASAHPDRVVLGTSIRGNFTASPPPAFGGQSYAEQCSTLSTFLERVEAAVTAKSQQPTESARAAEGACAKARIRFGNAAVVYNLMSEAEASMLGKASEASSVADGVSSKDEAAGPLTDVSEAKTESGEAPENERRSMYMAHHSSTVKNVLERLSVAQHGNEQEAELFLEELAYGGGGAPQHHHAYCPPSNADTEWETVDCHLHLLDFLQKSSGTTAALKAMDGCGVRRAVVFGMPCCKKWCFYRPHQPLYYQDDNGPCYVYAYADQMVADAWLALHDESRARFAPCFASFDPTDLGAVAHVKRMYDKYPRMWRGIGEVMCRHDDLTNMMMGREMPRVNHRGLDPIYKLATEIGLPVLVHHNCGRVGDSSEGSPLYLNEVEDVLTRYPELKFVWVHAGVSRRCAHPKHHEMIDRMCSTYDNLKVDISWVVWEDVICDDDGIVKKEWVDTICKHHTKFFIGSDNVAQFFPINDTSTNLLAMNITKYWQLFDKLPLEAAENVAYKNAFAQYFANWDVPSGAEGGRYARNEPFYHCESLIPAVGEFIVGQSALDDDGMY